MDEKSTPTSSSQGLELKKDNSDTKSVASRTTLTLDEKESLRPDDSASMHAPVEEDAATSPPESVATHSKPPSDPETRAFHDQLRQLRLSGDQRVVMPRAQRPAGLSEQRGGVIAFQAPAPINDFTPPPEVEIVRPRVTDPKMWVVPPDEKLMEALASPKDRLFVLKVEQDLIDFIKDPKYVISGDGSALVHSDNATREDTLQLPGTNSFYRMLSHKLADYYGLGHVVDDAMSSVRIFRTAGCRLPPPLINTYPGTSGSTPPPSAPARKIMRRNGEKGAPKDQNGDATFESLTSSKATSDTGSGGEIGKDGRPQSKGKLTREEREKRYDEARARIFKDFDAKEEKEKVAVNGKMENGVSRSSSTSGTKKNRTRQKKPKDDGFEARSAFDSFGRRFSDNNAEQSQPETPTFAPYYYDANGQMFANGQGYPSGQSFGVGMPNGNNGYNGMPTPSMQMPAFQQPQFAMGSPPPAQDAFGVAGPTYDGGHFSPPLGQDRTPKGTQPPLASYGQEQMQQSWPPNTYMDPYAIGGYQQYPDFNGYNAYYGQHMMQPMSPMSPHGFHAFSPPPQSYNQAYNGFGFNQPHFNPQSQAFVPGLRGGNAQQYPQPQQAQQKEHAGAIPQGGFTIPRQAPMNGDTHPHPQNHTGRGKREKLSSKYPTPPNLPAKPPAPSSSISQRAPRPDNNQPLPSKPIPSR